jgi:hypothetical protein
VGVGRRQLDLIIHIPVRPNARVGATEVHIGRLAHPARREVVGEQPARL